MPKTKTRKKGTGGVRSVRMMMAAMVALGCWGFAISFTFFTNNPDRYVLGAIAALLALTWSAYFGVRLRKWQQKR